MTTAADTQTEPMPGWVVAVLGALLLPLAAGAFVLSFEQLWPVMVLGGWSTSTAWLGPIVLDITAAAGAVMHVVGNDRSVKNWGLALLLLATVLSITGNLAGHNIATTPGGASRAQLPPEMTGWNLPDSWQPVVLALSIAAPTFVAVLVHAFGSILKAWLATRLATADSTRSDSTDTESAQPTGPDPLPTPAANSHPIVRPTADRPDLTGLPDPQSTDPTRPVSDSTADLHKSDESAHPTDPTEQVATRPDSQSTSAPTAVAARTDRHPTRPESDPTAPDFNHPTLDPTETRPKSHPTDSESATRPTDSEFDDLVARARKLVESGEIRPTADAIRPALGVGQAKAREIRDALKNDQRHGLRAVS